MSKERGIVLSFIHTYIKMRSAMDQYMIYIFKELNYRIENKKQDIGKRSILMEYWSCFYHVLYIFLL